MPPPSDSPAQVVPLATETEQTTSPLAKIGRPSIYTDDLAVRILDLYANGASLRTISEMDGMPGYRTIFDWRRDRESFRTALAHAREAKAESLTDDGLRLIDGCDGDSSSQVTKAREQAAYRRWLAACLDRATYGDALKVDADVKVAALVAFAPLGSVAQVAAARAVDAEAHAGGAVEKPPAK